MGEGVRDIGESSCGCASDLVADALLVIRRAHYERAEMYDALERCCKCATLELVKLENDRAGIPPKAKSARRQWSRPCGRVQPHPGTPVS